MGGRGLHGGAAPIPPEYFWQNEVGGAARG